VSATRAALTINGLAVTEDVFMDVFHRTAAGASIALTSAIGRGATQLYQGVPSAIQMPGDLHEAVVVAVPAGTGTARMVVDAFHTAGNRTMTLGPGLAAPTVTSAGSSPHARYRMQLPVQAEYGGMAVASFQQPARSATIVATAGYFATPPTTWDLVVPDLSGATGYNTEWGLRVGTASSWVAEASSRLIYFDLLDGETLRWGGRSGPAPPAVQSALSQRTIERGRGVRTLRKARELLMPPR
jgi:hypothetical protein